MATPTEHQQVLEAARGSGDLKALRRFLDGGGDPNLRGSGGQLTLLQTAAQNGCLGAVELLTQRRGACRVNDRSGKNGDTALVMAVKRGHAEVAKHLVQLGDCDLNAANNGGFTALMKAAKRGLGSVSLLLLQHGAELELASVRGGHTALTLAVACQRLRIVKLLLQFGASLDHRTSSGRDASDLAWDLKPDGPGGAQRKQEIVEALAREKGRRQGIKRDFGFSTDVLHGQYKITEVIGSGSFGAVFLADNLRSQSGCRAVVKALKPRPNHRTNEIHRDGLHEAKLMLMIDSPLVVRIEQYFKVDKFFCIAMEHCEFGDLHDWISVMGRRHRQFPSATATHWCLQMLLGLSYLHSNGILHRDIKPKNVFLKQDGTAKIGDLGLSRRLLGAGDYATSVVGTIAYMAPEILRNVARPVQDVLEVPAEGYDARCDIWSLGCTLYELCTCRMLFDSDDIKEAVCGGGALPGLPDRFSQDLGDLFRLMMVRERRARASCQELLASEAMRTELGRMKELGCEADAGFLLDNSRLLKLPSGQDPESQDEDTATMVPKAGDHQRLWREVDGVLGEQPPERLRPRRELSDDSISDTVPASILEALGEQLQFGFPLEQLYRRSLANLGLPERERWADYSRFTDDMDACEKLEALVVCELTK